MAKYELIITDTNSQVSILAKGDQGPQGEIGPQGPQGTAGSGANNLADLGDVDSTSTLGQALISDGDGTFSFTTISGASETLDSVTGRGNTTTNSISVGGLNTHTIPSGTGTLALTSDIPTVPTNNNQLTNGAGYITDYTVTEGDVTAHQDALQLGATQITSGTLASARLPDLAVSDFAGSAIVTESEGLSSSDNDTSIPTTAAVIDYVDGAGSVYTAGDGLTLTGTDFDVDLSDTTIFSTSDASKAVVRDANGDFSAGTVTANLVGDVTGSADTLTFTAKNSTGSTLEKGSVVYVSGINGNTPEVSLARANSSSTMPAFGLVEADIANTADGTVTTFGSLTGLDVADYGETGITFSLGDTVYVSSSEAGKLTNVAPTGETNLIQNIGKIERATPTTNMTIKVGGAGRTNATPNLDDGDIFIGNGSNKAVTSDLNSEVRSRVSATGDLSYNSTTGAFSFTERTDADVQGLITGGTGVSVSSGQVAIGQAVGTTDNVSFGTVTAAVDLNGAVLTLDADADTTITADTDDQIDIAFGGNDRIQLSTGVIDLKNDGSQSEVRLYCESANAHYAALQAPAHADFSTNVTATLPSDSGTLALTKILPSAHTSAHTLVAADSGKHISITTGGVTVDTDVFEVGDAVSIYNNSGSDQTITQGTGATLRTAGTATTGNITLAQYGICTILCVVDSAGADEFVVSGGGIS
jgi:hypothetical protein